MAAEPDNPETHQEIAKAAFHEAIDKNRRRNFIFNVLEGAFVRFALTFASANLILTPFASKLTTSRTLVGLVPAISLLFWTLPQLVSAYKTEHLPRKRGLLVVGRLGKSVPWILLGIWLLTVGTENKAAALVVFLVLLTAFSVWGGFMVPPWVSFLAKLIRHTHLGRFYGLRAFIGTGMALGASFLAKLILESFDFPKNFGVIFIVTGASYIVATLFLRQTREPAEDMEENQAKRGLGAFFREAGEIIRRHKPFRLFLVLIVLTPFGAGGTAAGLAAGFYAVYAQQKHLALDSDLGIFMAILAACQLVSVLLGGWLIDRFSAKPAYALSLVFGLGSGLTALLASNLATFKLTFAFMGVAMGFHAVSYHNMILALAPARLRSTYLGIANTLRGPACFLAPLLGGIVADVTSFEFLFKLAPVGSVVTLLVLLVFVRVSRPREMRIGDCKPRN